MEESLKLGELNIIRELADTFQATSRSLRRARMARIDLTTLA